jgi:hypothetical protein
MKNSSNKKIAIQIHPSDKKLKFVQKINFREISLR